VPRAAAGLIALGAAAVSAAVGLMPGALVVAAFGLSALAYLMYWIDKSAAQSGHQRIAENTLHLVSLAGGWPGALIAQQQFRHKTIKQPFQSVFWFTAAINLAAVAWLLKSGVAAELARSLSS
jgi:uncharacterized membrane protein YsdA (DUF1294 family)